jgi:hypothetical protein
MGRKRVDLLGMRFGKLIVKSKNEIRAKHGAVMWLCICDCGKERLAMAVNLRQGNATSCGCESYETRKLHGMTDSREFKSWSSMRQRCLNKNAPDYHRYGERGIKICDRWNDSFNNFYEDMGDRPQGTSLDRIDNDGNYEKSNCKWSTRSEQQRNKSNSLFLEWNGIKKTAAEWSDQIGISSKIICERLKAGWQLNDVFTKPIRRKLT